MRKVVPAVLVYARNRGRTLMLHRTRPGSVAEGTGDHHSGKWNGLGGKHELERDESPLEAARREFAEESGVELEESRFRALGAVGFPKFKKHKPLSQAPHGAVAMGFSYEDWQVTVLTADLDDAEAMLALTHVCAEGQLQWIADSQVAGLNLWAGDAHFIGLVLERKPFFGTIWYEGETVKRVWIQKL
jgi:8-oxo-dGTP diphosphatase